MKELGAGEGRGTLVQREVADSHSEKSERKSMKGV